MIQEVKLPEVSENIESGDVVKVLVKEGDMVELEQPVIELETEKAMFEVPSTAKGKVTEVNVKEGESIKIGSVIIKVETEGDKEEAKEDKEKVEDKVKEKAEDEDEKEKAEEKKDNEKKDNEKKDKDKEDQEKEDKGKKQEVDKEDKEDKTVEKKGEEKKDKKEDKEDKENSTQDSKNAKSSINSTDSTVSKEAPPASPSVRRLARELGVDIHKVNGSGTGGRISEEDVKAYVKEALSKPAAQGGGISHRALPDFSKWGDIRKEPMSKVRRITAEGLSYAWSSIPMVTQFDKADITSLEEFRKKYGKTVEADKGSLTVTSILVKVATAALKKFPQFNSSIDMENEEIIFKDYYNIGIAVDTDRGLLVPVIKDADKKNIHDISVELTELAGKTRDKKIKPDEMEGGTFTISNLGGIGGTNFTPIVYSPQVAILGVSRGSKEAVYKDNELTPKMMLPLSLTYDHRIIDGADAARFLRWVCEALENPFVILL